MDPYILEKIKLNKLTNKFENFQQATRANLIVINSVKTGENNEVIYPNTNKIIQSINNNQSYLIAFLFHKLK